MATYEGGDAQGSPGRRAAGLAGRRPLPRLRDHGSVAGRQRRAARSSDRDRLPGAAPARAGGAGEGHLVASWRAPPPRLPADRGRSPRARSRARSMAPVLRRDDEPAGAGTAAADPRAGLTPLAAAKAAADEFGDPPEVAAAFRPGLAASHARRVAITLLATGPVVIVVWTGAALGSHIGPRQAPPGQWAGAAPAWRSSSLSLLRPSSSAYG